MLKELYKTLRTEFIKKRLDKGDVRWGDVWWTLKEYGNTIHLRESLRITDVELMDSISHEIVKEFKDYAPVDRDVTEEERAEILRFIYNNHQ